MDDLLTLMRATGFVLPESFWMKDAWWWSAGLAAVGLAGLIAAVAGLVRLFRNATICRVPLAAVNEVEINRTGEMFLRFEVPKNSSMTGENLRYELLNRQRGDAAVELKPVPKPLTVKSGQKRSIPVSLFEITETGKYTLKVSGFEPQMLYLRYYLVISRLRLWKAVLYVLGIVLGGLLFVGGLVFAIIVLSANG